MQISGGSITPFIARVNNDFAVDTKLALSWEKTRDGNWFAIDRGAAADVYEAVVTVTGDEADIEAVLEAIESRRVDKGYTLSLSAFEATEHIFGEDVDHSGTITAAVMEFGRRIQRSWRGWGLTMRVRALSPAFVGTSSFPSLVTCDVGVDADGEDTVIVTDTYNSTMSYLDTIDTRGTFSGVFTLSAADMRSMRRYIASQRGGDFSLSDTFGIDYPFGPRGAAGYPYTCKLIGWADSGMWGVGRWKIALTFAEVV